MNRLPLIALATALLPLAALAAAPALDLSLPNNYVQSLPLAAPAASSSATPDAARVPPAHAAHTAGGLHPVVWGSTTTAAGYAQGFGSSFWQGADVNASQAVGDTGNPLIITGGVAGAVGYSHALGTTQWEGAHVEMSKLFGSARHPFALTLGIAVSHARALGNGSWFQQPPPP